MKGVNTITLLTFLELFVGLSGLLGIMALFFLCFSSASVVCDLITRESTEINTGQFLSLKEEKGGRNFKLLVLCLWAAYCLLWKEFRPGKVLPTVLKNEREKGHAAVPTLFSLCTQFSS